MQPAGRDGRGGGGYAMGKGGWGGGRGGRATPRALSSRIPPGKLLTVRTFRETPRTPSYPFWPLPCQMPTAGSAAVSTIHDRNSHFFSFPVTFSDPRVSSLLASSDDYFFAGRERERTHERQRTRERERERRIKGWRNVILFSRIFLSAN